MDLDITDDHFDVGFIQNTSAVSIRTNEDLSEIWEQVLNSGKSVMLWCDGMVIPSTNKRKRAASGVDDESDDDTDLKKSKKKKKTDTDREDRVEKIVQSLKAKHGDAKYTPMQYRVWGEMVAGGVHASEDNPPSTTMFVRCGTVTNKRKSTSDVVVDAIDKLSQVLSPKVASPVRNHSHSPAKIIESRSKCYRQLSELKNLHVSGVLTDEEYTSEKKGIMASLKSLK